MATTPAPRTATTTRRPFGASAAPVTPRNQPAAAKAALSPSDPIAKLRAIEAWAGSKVVGRSASLRALTLALAARVNVLMIGPPGTAKTMLVELVGAAFCPKPGDFFSTMLTKFSKPAEVFGPVDIGELQKGTLRTDTTGYLPEAKVGAVDEIFKGSSAILNSMLTIANERRFRNGHEWQQTPLRMIAGMSNEYPEDPVILAAFFDRFPLKLKVGYLDAGDFGTMVANAAAGGAVGSCPVTLTDKDFETIDARVESCSVPANVVDALAELRSELNSKGVVVSDRRWVQAVRILRAAAVMDGRDEVRRGDLPAIASVLWNNDQQAATINAVLPEFVNPYARAIREVAKEVYAERAKILAAARGNRGPGEPVDQAAAMAAAGSGLARVNSHLANLSTIKSQCSGDDLELVGMAEASVKACQAAIAAVMKGGDGVQKLLDSQAADLT